MTDPDYGADLDWGSDLEPNALLIDGPKLLGQAAFHAIFTPRGACLDSPNRGIDIREFLHKGMTETERAEVPSLIRQELVEDERIQDVDVIMIETLSKDGISWDLRIMITPKDAGPFELVCSVADAIPKIVSIQEVAA